MTRSAIPLAELHCHIEGAAPPELVRRLAARYGISAEGLFAADGGYRWHDFTSFLGAYDRASAVFRTPDDYRDLAGAYFSSIAAEGAIYGEIFISPDHAAAAGLSYAAYRDGLAAGIAAAGAKTGIVGRMIVVGIRHFGVAPVEAAARLAAAEPHPWVTGFGMAGEERFGRVADYLRAFLIARDAGLSLTVHAGELAGPESVRDALDHLPVTRLGHGVRAIEDPALVARIAAAGIVLELCPGSNVALGLYPGFAAHPFRRLMDAGCRVTLNSDDPPFFHTSLGAEYAAMRNAQDFSDGELRAVTRTAIEAAFVDEETRAQLLADLDAHPAEPSRS